MVADSDTVVVGVSLSSASGVGVLDVPMVVSGLVLPVSNLVVSDSKVDTGVLSGVDSCLAVVDSVVLMVV